MQDNSNPLRLWLVLISMLFAFSGSTQVDSLVLRPLYELYERIQNSSDNYLDLKHCIVNLKEQDTTLYTRVIISKYKDYQRIDYSPTHFELVDSKYRIDINHTTKQITLKASQANKPIDGSQLLNKAIQAKQWNEATNEKEKPEIAGIVKFPPDLGLDSIAYIKKQSKEQFKHYMYVNERFYHSEAPEKLQVLLFTQYEFSSKKQPKQVFKNKYLKINDTTVTLLPKYSEYNVINLYH